MLTLAIIVISLLAAGCSLDDDRTDPAIERAEPSAESAGPIAKRLADPRPSVILVVLDTLRADAVSAHGKVEGTTPNLDALAARGIRYEHAYAPAPWTAASHVSLFTGLRVDEHGVGLDGLVVAPDSLQMLAEDFRAAGYTTASFAENALIHEEFGFEQGFDRFESPDLIEIINAELGGEPVAPFRLVPRLRDWNERRDKSRPYFLFVNLFEAHEPYAVRDENPWIPEGVEREELEYIFSKYVVARSLCDALPTKKHLALFRGLYLGDVAAADAKLGEILRILEDGEEAIPKIIVATSDHGEHLGENRLMGHRFSVRNVALHIPLIVAGVPGLQPKIIEEQVELRSIHSSLLCWALGHSCPAGLPLAGRPVSELRSTPDPIFSIYSDTVVGLPKWVLERFEMTREEELPSQARSKCHDEDRVFGEMVSMIRYPMKIIWFSENDFVLHDLRWDAAERADQMQRQPELAASLRAELETFVRRHVLSREKLDVPEISEEALRTLEILGYIR